MVYSYIHCSHDFGYGLDILTKTFAFFKGYPLYLYYPCIYPKHRSTEIRVLCWTKDTVFCVSLKNENIVCSSHEDVWKMVGNAFD